MLNSLGKSAHCAHKPTLKLFFQKKVDQRVKQSASVFLAKFDLSVWNMPLHTMNVLEFGADYQSANVVASSVALPNTATLSGLELWLHKRH
jgi:hypothetical protein